MNPPTPDLSIVLVTPDRFANIRRTVRHLRAQTVKDRLELVIVAPSADALADTRPDEAAGFCNVTVVPVGPIENVEEAAASGVRRAGAAVVAIIEDHAYPDPTWAEAVIEAHRYPHAAVGPAVLNANPGSLTSWANMLMAYGRWHEGGQAGVTAEVARHNSAFKREVLVAYGTDLERMLGREGGLLQDLLGKGHRFYFEPAARVAHVNPSTLSSTADLRFNAGRLYGANRAAREGWSFAKRLAYAVGGPLIPLVRFRRMQQELLAGGQRRDPVPSALPALFLGLVLDAAGQMVGYAFGPGRSLQKLAVFEMDRLQHLTRRDLSMLAE